MTDTTRFIADGGSSPRMRGTRQDGGLGCFPIRFIPAHAGNTRMPTRYSSAATVHPRACGEHAERGHGTADVVGSSPRMRGTHRDGLGAVVLGRFIPAHAGNTRAISPAPGAAPVHPRACGEHRVRVREAEPAGGSSQRMRGTRRQGGDHAFRQRFIPAHAGNTCASGISRCTTPVHPRACGEHPRRRPTIDARCGSSPRMRGTPSPSSLAGFLVRFIPAHAGNTPSRPELMTSPSVHPRACGEHAVRERPAL